MKTSFPTKQRWEQQEKHLGRWRSKAPLMPLRIFRSRALSASSAVLFTLLGSFFSFLLIYTLYLQEVLHSTPLMASLLLLPGSILTIPITQFVAPWLMNRLGVRRSLVLGMVCLFCGIALFLKSGTSAECCKIVHVNT
jgi:Na+/melibiose symporter-like transporter